MVVMGREGDVGEGGEWDFFEMDYVIRKRGIEKWVEEGRDVFGGKGRVVIEDMDGGWGMGLVIEEEVGEMGR